MLAPKSAVARAVVSIRDFNANDATGRVCANVRPLGPAAPTSVRDAGFRFLCSLTRRASDTGVRRRNTATETLWHRAITADLAWKCWPDGAFGDWANVAPTFPFFPQGSQSWGALP